MLLRLGAGGAFFLASPAGGRSTWLRLERRQFLFDLGLALVQCLETQLPAVKLNTQLIDVTGNLRALRRILGQLMFHLINPRLGL